MVITECIPFKNFKAKIAITTQYSNCKCEVIDNFVYIERKEIRQDSN